MTFEVLLLKFTVEQTSFFNKSLIKLKEIKNLLLNLQLL